MIKLLKNLAIFSTLIIALKVFGLLIDKLPIWAWLTQFFVFIRTITRPLDFLWHFETSWQIIGLILSILTAYSFVQAYLIIRNNFKD